MTEISNLKLIREKSGLSQAQLSALLGIPKRTIENYETGSRVPPDWVMDLLVDYIINHVVKKEIVYDRNHGVYSMLDLRNLLKESLKDTKVKKAYLTGDYIEGNAKVSSALNILVICPDDCDISKVQLAIEKIAHKKVEIERVFYKKNKLYNQSNLERRGLQIYTKQK